MSNPNSSESTGTAVPASTTTAGTAGHSPESTTVSNQPSVKSGIFSGLPKPSYLPKGVGEEVLKRGEQPGSETQQQQQQTQTGEGQQPAQGQETQQAIQTAQSAVQPQQIVPLTPEALAELVAKVRTEPQQQPQGQQGQSQEEFHKAFNIFQADDATYEAILGVKPDTPERVTALNTALQGVARQAVTIARYLMQQEVNKLNQQINPIIASNRAAWEQQQESVFYSKFPDLKEYRPLLVELVNAAKSRGMTFPNETAAMEYLSKTAYNLLRRQPGQAAPAGGQSQQQAGGPPTAANQMPTLSGGGRSGSNGGAAPVKSTGQRIFGSLPNNFVRK